MKKSGKTMKSKRPYTRSKPTKKEIASGFVKDAQEIYHFSKAIEGLVKKSSRSLIKVIAADITQELNDFHNHLLYEHANN